MSCGRKLCDKQLYCVKYSQLLLPYYIKNDVYAIHCTYVQTDTHAIHTFCMFYIFFFQEIYIENKKLD